MPTASMGPVSPSSGMVLTVKIHKDRNGHVIMKDPTPFLSPLSSVGSSSPSSSPSDNLKQGNSQQAVYICERSPMMDKIHFETDELSICTQKEHEEELLENKAMVILNCLGGIFTSKRNSMNEVKLVDLWHLRQLALTYGGLINASIRKRAWLKLLDANDHIFTTSAGLPWDTKQDGNNSSTVVSLSDDEIALIQGDIEQCKWDVENLIKVSRKIRKHQRRTGKNVGFIIDGDTDSISNASFGSGLTSNGRITPQMIPESIRAFPRVGGHSGDGCSSPPFHLYNPLADQETISSTDKGTFSIAEEEAFLSQDPPQSIGKRKISREERSLLLNIVLSVLRELPNDAYSYENEESRRLYYFQGMYNIAAVLLITLESPSLSSLAIQKLAQFHFRDYCAPTFMNTQAAIRIIFMPLLKEMDPLFHQTMLDKGICDPCSFVLPWIICWYANDIFEYDIVCRLFDVFMASHALLPIYIAVAFITHPWSKSEFDRNVCEGSDFMSILASIPSNMVSLQSHTSASFCIEQVIECSLTAIRNYPPDKIVKLAEKYPDEQVLSSTQIQDSIIQFQEPPQWTYKASASTDWTLIQEARKLRESSPHSREVKKQNIHSRANRLTAITQESFDFDLALDASGLSKSIRTMVVPESRRKKDTHKSKLGPYILNVCMLLLLSIVVQMTYDYYYACDNRNVSISAIPQVIEIEQMILTRKEIHLPHDDDDDVNETIVNSDTNNITVSMDNTSTSFEIQPILDSTKIHTLLWTLPSTCADSWCAVPIDQLFGDIDWTNERMNVPVRMKSNVMEAFVSFSRDLIQSDPDCFFVMM